MSNGSNTGGVHEPEFRAASSSVWRVACAYGITALFVFLCGYYIAGHADDFAFVRSLSWPETVGAALLIVGCFLITAYQFRLFLDKFGVSPSPLELIAITMGMTLGNLVSPMRGGSGALALYLKRVHRLEFTAFAAIYGGTALLIALINAGAALLSLAFLWLFHGFFHVWLSLFVFVMFLVSFCLCVFPPPVRWRRGGIVGAVVDSANSWRRLTRDRFLLTRLTLSFVVVALALAVSLYLIYAAMGSPMPFEAVLVTAGLGNIAMLIPLTPGSLGIFDAVVIQVPQLFGLDPARSLMGAVVFRVLMFGWAFALGVPGLLYAMRISRRAMGADSAEGAGDTLIPRGSSNRTDCGK